MKMLFAILIAMLFYSCGFHDGARYQQEKQPLKVMSVTATAYSYPGPGCWKCGGGKHMASGNPPYVGAIAVSDDLLSIMPIGSVVEINGWRYRVEDRMASNWKRRIDFFMGTVHDARVWGKRPVRLALMEAPSADWSSTN